MSGTGDQLHVTAHRGFAGIYPQNTLAAVTGAAHHGVDRIEIDVWPTADGEIVVFHDTRLDRLTDQTGLVTETACEHVRNADVLRSGESIPTLREVCTVVDPSITLNIEFKGCGPYTWETFAERVLEITTGVPNELLISSFHSEALSGVRAVDENVPLALLFEETPERSLNIARQIDVEAINPSLVVLTRDLAERAHREKRNVNAFTIRNWEQARYAVELGVDGLIADYPNLRPFATGER